MKSLGTAMLQHGPGESRITVPTGFVPRGVLWRWGQPTLLYEYTPGSGYVSALVWQSAVDAAFTPVASGAAYVGWLGEPYPSPVAVYVELR